MDYASSTSTKRFKDAKSESNHLSKELVLTLLFLKAAIVYVLLALITSD